MVEPLVQLLLELSPQQTFFFCAERISIPDVLIPAGLYIALNTEFRKPCDHRDPDKLFYLYYY